MSGRTVLHDACNTPVVLVTDPDTGEVVLYCPGHDCRHDVPRSEVHLEPARDHEGWFRYEIPCD